MKNRGLKLFIIFFSSVILLTGFSIPAFAAGMSVSVGETGVAQGSLIPVTVTFSGSNLWYGYVNIECDPILSGGGTFLIESESAKTTLSDTYEIYATENGTGQIRISGYTSSFENGKAYDSEMYGPEVIEITVGSGANGTETAPGRSAGAGEDGRDENGNLINNNAGNDPKEAGAAANGEKKSPDPSAKKQTETKKTDGAQKTKDSEKEKQEAAFGIILFVIGAAVLVSLVAFGIILLVRRKKRRKEDRWEYLTDDDPDLADEAAEPEDEVFDPGNEKPDQEKERNDPEEKKAPDVTEQERNDTEDNNE